MQLERLLPNCLPGQHLFTVPEHVLSGLPTTNNVLPKPFLN
jgi:hypothetical protein